MRARSTFLTTKLSLGISLPWNQKAVWIEKILSYRCFSSLTIFVIFQLHRQTTGVKHCRPHMPLANWKSNINVRVGVWKWKRRERHWNLTLMLWEIATLWAHTASWGTTPHFILLNRLNVVWEINRIMTIKANSESQEARKTQHQQTKSYSGAPELAFRYIIHENSTLYQWTMSYQEVSMTLRSE